MKDVYTADYFESAISDQLFTLKSSRGKTLFLVGGLISTVLSVLWDRRCVLGDRRCVLRDRRCVLGERQCALRDRRCVLGDRRCVLRDRRCVLRDRRCVLGDRRCVLGDRRCVLKDRRCVGLGCVLLCRYCDVIRLREVGQRQSLGGGVACGGAECKGR